MMAFTIPAAIVQALRHPVPVAADFSPMHFTPAETKAWFASHFLRFASADFPKHHFTLRFYRQIMNTFGMIAHYDSMGFWTEYFTDTAGKIEFLEQVLSWNSYGDPTTSFCDAEREIARRLRDVGLLDLYRGKGRAERDAAERAQYARLKARFEPGGLESIEASSTASLKTANHGTSPAAPVQLTFVIG
jgi:hypothetical protein